MVSLARQACRGQTAGTYAGFDRFGRVGKQLWRYYGGTPADRKRKENSKVIL